MTSDSFKKNAAFAANFSHEETRSIGTAGSRWPVLRKNYRMFASSRDAVFAPTVWLDWRYPWTCPGAGSFERACV